MSSNLINTKYDRIVIDYKKYKQRFKNEFTD